MKNFIFLSALLFPIVFCFPASARINSYQEDMNNSLDRIYDSRAYARTSLKVPGQWTSE